MALEISAATLYLAFFGLLQLAVAAVVLRGDNHRWVRALSSVLFILNGMATLSTAIGSFIPAPSWTHAATAFFDAPTGLMFIPLAVAVYQSGIQRNRTFPLKKITIGVSLVALAGIIFIAIAHEQYFGLRLAIPYAVWPLFIGYGLLFLALVDRLRRADQLEDLRLWAFLLIGFGARIIEFTWIYSIHRFIADMSSGALDWQAPAWLLLLPAVIVGSVWLVRQARGRPDDQAGLARMPLWVFPLALLIGLYGAMEGFIIGGGDWPQSIGYAVGFVTVFFVRPLFVGYAFEPLLTTRLVGASGIGFSTYFASKALLAALTERDFFTLSALDVGAIAVAGFVVLLAWGWLRRRTTKEVVKTQPEKLIEYLLERGKEEGFDGASAAEIEKDTGISAKNLAGVVRGARTVLNGIDAVRIVEDVRGVRGRKHYLLKERS